MNIDSLVHAIGATTCLAVGYVVLILLATVVILFVGSFLIAAYTATVEYIKSFWHPLIWIVIDESDDGEYRNVRLYRDEVKARGSLMRSDQKSIYCDIVR